MPTMRKDARTANVLNVSECHGYHGSRFHQLSYYDSDRNRLLSAVSIPRGFGLEIETECSMIRNELAYANVLEKIVLADLPNDFCRLEEDGSLGDSHRIGIEIPTQIMTKQRMRNEYRNFKSMFDWMPHFGISCSETGHCGMHVNISSGFFGRTKKTQYDAMRKLLYFVNHNFELCCALFMRSENHTTYCGKMGWLDDKNVCKTVDLDNFDTHRIWAHRLCMNCDHIREPINSSRIELRLVAGQKNYNTFRNTMETVFFICERVKSISWDDIDNLGKFFSGCNQYVIKRIDLANKTWTDGRYHPMDEKRFISTEMYETIKTNSIYENLELEN